MVLAVEHLATGTEAVNRRMATHLAYVICSPGARVCCVAVLRRHEPDEVGHLGVIHRRLGRRQPCRQIEHHCVEFCRVLRITKGDAVHLLFALFIRALDIVPLVVIRDLLTADAVALAESRAAFAMNPQGGVVPRAAPSCSVNVN